MRPDHLVEFATRDRSELQGLKERHWRERRERLGPSAAFLAAGQLVRYVKEQRGWWPTPLERDEDLDHHIRVGTMLRRVATTRPD